MDIHPLFKITTTVRHLRVDPGIYKASKSNTWNIALKLQTICCLNCKDPWIQSEIDKAEGEDVKEIAAINAADM